MVYHYLISKKESFIDELFKKSFDSALFFIFFSSNILQMTVDISGILTKIVGVEGKQLLTNFTANC